MAGGKQAARSAHADSAHISKLESEIQGIKGMLSDFSQKQAARQDQISQIMGHDDENVDFSNKDSVREQRAILKEQKEKLDRAKEQYKRDKEETERLRLSDPEQYRKRNEVLSKVKVDIDRQISKLNERMERIKQHM